MPGKLSAEVRPINRARTQDLINAAIVLGAGIGKSPSKELLHSAIPIDKPIPMGHDCTRCAAVASCSLLNLVSKNNGDNPIMRRIKAIQMLKGNDPEFMQKTNNEQREAMIREKMGVLKNEAPLSKTTVPEKIPLPQKNPGLIEISAKKPEEKPEIKIRPMIVVNIPKPPVEKPAPPTKKEFKKELKREQSTIVNSFKKTPDQIPTKPIYPEIALKKAKTIFERIVYEKKEAPSNKIEVPKSLPKIRIKLEPIRPTKIRSEVKTETKFKEREKKIFVKLEKKRNRPRTIESKRTIELKPILKTKAKETKQSKTGVLVEKIKRVLLKEKQIPFAVVVLPILNEKPDKKQQREQRYEQKQEKQTIDYKVIPLKEKAVIHFINLASKVTKAVESLSIEENKKLVVRLVTLYDESLSPSPEEIKTGLNLQNNKMQLVIWYITKVFLALNNLDLYLLEA